MTAVPASAAGSLRENVMTAIRTIEGDFVAAQGRYALVVGRFNSFVVESLVDGAVDTLKRHGVKESDITIVRVPGAFEIPLMVRKVADLSSTMPSSPWAQSSVVVRRTSNTLPASASRVSAPCP